ncbi:Uncharacterised protein [Bordetella pertussis]|nr:Uncharacterised protein [Bordetella pertussis]
MTSALIDWPCTSMPRAATSVATSTRSWPRCSWPSVRVRWRWFMSPCSAAAAKPWSARRSARSSAPRLVAVNTMAWSRRASRSTWSSRRILCAASSAYSRLCVMLACFWRWPAISMRCGSRIMRSARRATLPSRVAENSRVWRSFGRRSMMVSISSMKPMSSMRSASSSTRVCTVFSLTRPAFRWSIRRPGVATSTSTRRDSALSCAP